MRLDGLRSRIVGKEYHAGTEAGLFASTPNKTVLHYLVSDLASDKLLCILIFDVRSAYLHAPLTVIYVVRPPKELRQTPDELWLARKAFPGLRISGRAYQDF